MKRALKCLATFAVAAVIAAPATMAPVTAQKAYAETVTFGFLAPLTGRFAANGERFKEAVDLFVKQTNANDGIGGRELVVLQEDDRGDPLQATAIAQKYVENADVVAAIGSFTSSASIAAGAIFAEARMPQVSPTSSHPDFTKISPFQFRIPNTQDISTKHYAEVVKQYLPSDSVAVIYYQDDWGLFVGEATKTALEKGGSEVPIYEAMLPETRDFRPLITKIRQADVDSIFLAGHYGPSATFLTQLRQAGLTVPVAAPEPLYNHELIELAGDAANGLITATYFFPGDPDKAAFVEAYSAEYGREPDLWAAFAWDAVAIAAEGARAVVEAGEELTREALRDAIDALPPFQGMTGETEFVDGTPDKHLTLLQIRDGHYFLYP